MSLVERIHIAAPPDAVWPHVADPERMRAWNPKLVAVRRAARGEVRAGERYAVTYRMSGKEQEMEAEVFRCEHPAALEIRNRSAGWPADRYVTELYELSAHDAGTTLRQTIDFGRAAIPLWARALIWLISRVGKPTGPTYLETLRQRVEGR